MNDSAKAHHNGHTVHLEPAPLPKAPHFGDCPLCGKLPLRLTRDRTSIVCEGCGTIMPAEWMEAA